MKPKRVKVRDATEVLVETIEAHRQAVLEAVEQWEYHQEDHNNVVRQNYLGDEGWQCYGVAMHAGYVPRFYYRRRKLRALARDA